MGISTVLATPYRRFGMDLKLHNTIIERGFDTDYEYLAHMATKDNNGLKTIFDRKCNNSLGSRR